MTVFATIHAVAPGVGPTYPGHQVTYTDSSGRAPGLTPIGYILEAISVSTDDTSTSTPRTSIAFCDGTNEVCVGVVGEHNAVGAANILCSRFAYTGASIIIGNTNGGTTPAMVATFVSFGVNEVTLEFSASSGADFDIILVYGVGGSTFHVGTLAGHATSGSTAAITGLPGTPAALWAIGAGNLAFGASAASADAVMSYGFAGRLPSISQACTAFVWESQQSATSVGNVPRNNRIAAEISSAAATITAGAGLEVTAFNSDGATLTTRDASASIEIGWAALVDGDRRAVVVHPNLPTGTAASFSRTDIGFKPMALFFSSVRNLTIDNVGNQQGAFFSGFALSTTQGSTSVYWRDAVTTSNGYGRHTQTYAGQMILASVGAIYFRFTFDSFTATGWDGTVADAAAGSTDVLVAYMAIEETYSPGWIPATRRWRRQLARM